MVSENITVSDAEVEEFRQEVRSWLLENLPEGWGTPEYVSPPLRSREGHELGSKWQKKLYDVGYTGFGYPKEYGGIERPAWQIAVIGQEIGRTGVPAGRVSNDPVAGPTILASGQEWQKKRFLPKMLSGEEAWVQGFSEPNAGSDLANVQTTAVRDGDEWVVNGQKVWNSSWEYADFGLLVVKTDPDAPTHRNLSYFIFDTKTPGFEKRPLKQMTGDTEFSEMFFDNVRIPHENLLGELNQGWYAAMSTLVAERGNLSGFASVGRHVHGRASDVGGVAILIGRARNTRRRGAALWDDAVVRQRIAQFAIENEAMKASGARANARVQKGIATGEEVNIGKVFSAEARQRQADFVLEMIGAYSQLMKGSKYAVDDGQLVFEALRSRGATIEAGSSEINRNVIAERILGLPRIK